jgi:hypothetical protein
MNELKAQIKARVDSNKVHRRAMNTIWEEAKEKAREDCKPHEEAIEANEKAISKIKRNMSNVRKLFQ